jgi:hypothetical protein
MLFVNSVLKLLIHHINYKIIIRKTIQMGFQIVKKI